MIKSSANGEVFLRRDARAPLRGRVTSDSSTSRDLFLREVRSAFPW